MLTLLLLPAIALASEDACTACCRAGGLASCEPRIQLFGEGSGARRQADAWRVDGLWTISCDGVARLDWSATAVLDHEPRAGEIVTASTSPLQIHCFRQACALPAELCVGPADESGRFSVNGCETALPPDARDLSRPPPTGPTRPTTLVVIGGKPLVVQATVGPGRPASSASQGSAVTNIPATPTSAAATVTVRPDPGPPTSAPARPPEAPSPRATPAPVASTAPAPMASTAPTASTAPAALTATAPPRPDSSDDPGLLGVTLPKDPPDPCKAPPEALRSEARKRVELGDERRVARDAKGAAQEYRAALTMDLCNAYAWLGLGEVASGATRPDLAIRTLRNTTRIMPGHYGAWVLLGKSYEAIGQRQLAAEAYDEALALRPGLTEAQEGRGRTGGP